MTLRNTFWVYTLSFRVLMWNIWTTIFVFYSNNNFLLRYSTVIPCPFFMFKIVLHNMKINYCELSLKPTSPWFFRETRLKIPKCAELAATRTYRSRARFCRGCRNSKWWDGVRLGARFYRDFSFTGRKRWNALVVSNFIKDKKINKISRECTDCCGIILSVEHRQHSNKKCLL